MSKSNKASPRHFKNSLSAATNYERCANCNSRIPSYLLDKHGESCSKMSETKMKKSFQTKDSLKNNQTSVEETIFPKIRSHISQDNTKTAKRIILHSSGPKPIKIRQQLRCFRIAEEVQKIQCEFCGRRFSEQASLRHIPICSVLKQKQQKKEFFNKDTKNPSKRQKTKLQGFGKSYELTISKPINITKSPTDITVMQQIEKYQEKEEASKQNPQLVENCVTKQVEQK